MGSSSSHPSLPPHTEDKLQKVLKKMEYSDEDLKKMKSEFYEDMEKGWAAGKGAGCPGSVSSLKMLTSHVSSLPDGTQEGAFYALDLGGTNLRVLRVELKRDEKAAVAEHRKPIKAELMAAYATGKQLFDFIAETAKELTDQHGETSPCPAGFTFSFPMSQSAVNCGKLLEWTKGFETQGVVGEDPAALLQASFDALKVPLKVVALCNDTVGTLMTCAYQFEGCTTAKIGVILGTGTNAAYVDPALGVIVNIEWGAFDKKLKRSSFDEEVDRISPNKGKQFFEKMISGMYIGEITRLAALEVLGEEAGERLRDRSRPFLTVEACALLEGGEVEGVPAEEGEVVRRVADAVLDRAALLTSVALGAVADKAGVFKARLPSDPEGRRGSNGQRLTIGFDGSMYTKSHRFQDRLKEQMSRVMGEAKSSMVHTVHSEDGSGVGAALVAAAVAGK